MSDETKRNEVKGKKLSSGIVVKPVYSAEDTKDLDYGRDLGDPGSYPYTRGIHPTMYTSQPWTVRQYAGFSTAEDTNARFKYLLSQGQKGLSLAFDLPTQHGLDSDDPLADGEVGRVGVAVDTLKDLEDIFQGIPLDQASTSMTMNALCPVILAMYVTVAEKQGLRPEQIRGTIQNDILKEYVARGTWVFPPGPSLKLIGDTIEYCIKAAPKFNPISVSGYHMREAGCNAVQEIAFTFAIAKAYSRHMLTRGLGFDDFAPQISFLFACKENIFEEVAKYRAARRLWAKIAKEEFGAQSPRSMWLRMMVGGGGVGLTAQQPLNNIVRGAYSALIGALSGAQSVAVRPYDEAYAIPTEKSQRIALRTQQILMHETGICDTVDPLAGSYYVESLTNEMERRMVECIEEVERMGGVVRAIENGFIQRVIAQQAYEEERRLQSGEKVKVGLNKFVDKEEDEEGLFLFQYDPTTAERQLARLRKVKIERDQGKVDSALKEIAKAVRAGENVMPATLEAVRAYATLGEITKVLRDQFGEFNEPLEF